MGDTAAASSGKYYSLTTDIDASATAGWNDADTDTDVLEGFKPIGTWSNPDTTSFRGIFNGGQHTISGLIINRPGAAYVGLFGCVGVGGQVRNLGLVGGAVTGGTYYVGGLVGVNSYGTVSNCYATGAVTGEEDVGGLVGDNDPHGTVSNCYATGAVSGTGTTSAGCLGGEYGWASDSTASGGSRARKIYCRRAWGYNTPWLGSRTARPGWDRGQETNHRRAGMVGYRRGTVSIATRLRPVSGNTASAGWWDTTTPTDGLGTVRDRAQGTGNNGRRRAGGTTTRHGSRTDYGPGAGLGGMNFIGGLGGITSGTVSNCYADRSPRSGKETTSAVGGGYKTTPRRRIRTAKRRRGHGKESR
jgi:hypothetical protein